MNIKLRWFIFTVIIGLLPFFSRLLVYYSIDGLNSDFIFNPSDFVAFGLVLHISIINEVLNFESNKTWFPITHIGVSSAFVFLYSLLFAITLFASINQSIKINEDIFPKIILGMNFVSLLLSYSVFDKISKEKGVTNES